MMAILNKKVYVKKQPIKARKCRKGKPRHNSAITVIDLKYMCGGVCHNQPKPKKKKEGNDSIDVRLLHKSV
jgi:hypothetical protein